VVLVVIFGLTIVAVARGQVEWNNHVKTEREITLEIYAACHW
jgi:hypothetical protein